MNVRRHAASLGANKRWLKCSNLIRLVSLVSILVGMGAFAVPAQAQDGISRAGRRIFVPQAFGTGSTSSRAPGTPSPSPTPPPAPAPPRTSSGKTVDQAVFYDAPTDGKSEQTVADLAELVIFVRSKFSSYVPNLRAKGFNGLELQYFMANEVTAAGYYRNSSAWCDSSYKPTSDQVAVNTGDFCRYIHPNEEWFLHNSKGERLADRRGSGDYQYQMNPASSGWRNFVRQRLLTDLFGSSSQAKIGADGFFLDNVGLRIYKFQHQVDNSDGTVREYSSDAAYRSAISSYLSFMREKLPNTPLWANVIDDWSVSASDYLATTSHLSGFMNEAWGLFYPSQPIKTEYWQINMAVADGALARGQSILAVVQGDQSNYQRQQFGLASYLLISDSDQTYFRYAKAGSYRAWWQYDNYKVSLGEPKGKRYQTSTGWRRDFACGYVTVDLAAKTGSITQTCR